MDDSSDEEIELTLKPLRRAMKDMYEDLTRIIEQMRKIESQLEKPKIKDKLDPILHKALEQKIKGPEVYDFIIENIK